MQSTCWPEMKQQFPCQWKVINTTSPQMLALFSLHWALHGIWRSGYECTGLFRALPRSQSYEMHSISKYSCVCFTKSNRSLENLTTVAPSISRAVKERLQRKYLEALGFRGCFSPPSSIDVAGTCSRWQSAFFWWNGLLQARCSI